jgi:hypothetical protein
MAKKKANTAVSDQLVAMVLALPWMDILAQTYKLLRTLWRGLADEGIYEVLEYESTLELLDRKGVCACFRKRQKVRYLQNNIIAYQDQGWSDGEGLLDYQCSPGVVVDQYRPGQKTYILISLRESKRRGDVDEFHMEWSLREAFRRTREQWETEVNHRTRMLLVRLIFPKPRPPVRVWLEEQLRRRTRLLSDGALKQLADGRWQVVWQTDRPRLHERYVLRWEW